MLVLDYVIHAPAWKTKFSKSTWHWCLPIIHMNWLHTLKVIKQLFSEGFYWLILPNDVSEGGGGG